MVVLEAPLVAAHPHLDLAQRRIKGRVGVRARAGGVELLARREAHDAVDAETVAILADHDLGLDAASLEVPFDA